MKVYGAGFGDVGHDIDVHIWAGFAVKDGGWVWQPVYFFGFSVLVGFIAIRWVVRRLRRAPNVTAESIWRLASRGHRRSVRTRFR